MNNKQILHKMLLHISAQDSVYNAYAPALAELLAAPPSPQPVAESSGLSACACCGAPEGEWVVRPAAALQPVAGLTDAEIDAMAKASGYQALPTVRLAFQGFYLHRFARAIEAHIKGQTNDN